MRDRALAGTPEMLAGLHARLVHRIGETGPAAVASILDLGMVARLHGVLEQVVSHLAHPLLDAGVVAQLQQEHEWLAEHLELLESLWRAEPESADLPPLAAAVLERLTEHVARDQRLLYDSPRLRATAPDAPLGGARPGPA